MVVAWRIYKHFIIIEQLFYFKKSANILKKRIPKLSQSVINNDREKEFIKKIDFKSSVCIKVLKG